MIVWPIPIKSGKYLNWYYDLIENAKKRTFPEGEYSESHHILPKSLGGSNKKSNIVQLYAREHYIAHILLYKIQLDSKNKGKMAFALLYMAHGSKFPKRLKRTYKVNSKIYELARKANGEAMLNKVVSESTRQKIREANARTKEIRSQKLSGENNGFYGKKHTAETLKQLSESSSKYWTEENREKKSISAKKLWENLEFKNKMIESRLTSEGWLNRDWKAICKKSGETKKKNGFKNSEEAKRKMSQTRRDKLATGEIVPWNKGKKVGVFRTTESLKKGAKKAAETRKKNGTQVSMKGEKNPFYGKKHTPETLEKIRATKEAKKAAGWVYERASKTIKKD